VIVVVLPREQLVIKVVNVSVSHPAEELVELVIDAV
jgi:hypothetical protein